MSSRRPLKGLGALLVLGVLAALFAIPAGAQTGQRLGLADLSPDRLAVGGVLHSYDPAWDDGLYATTAVEEFDAVTATVYICLLYTSDAADE